MEVLQQRSECYGTESHVLSEDEALRQHKNLERLEQLPPVPSSALSPKPLDEVLVAVSTNASSTISSSTYESTVDSRSVDSTPRTSILFKPALFKIQKVHVAPTMTMEARLHTTWISQIKDPLRIVLNHEISAGSCVREFMMAGRSQDKLKPTIVVSCGDLAIMKQVEKIFKSLDWLRIILKANHISFVAVIGPTKLSSFFSVFSDHDDPSMDEESIELTLENIGRATSFCGRRMRIQNGQQVTSLVVGGLLLLDHVPFALTAGHAFLHPSTAQQPSVDGEALSGMAPSRSSQGCSADANEPFWYDSDDDPDDSDSVDSTSTDMLTHSDRCTSQSLFADPVATDSSSASVEGLDVPVEWNDQPMHATITRPTQQSLDWATIAFNDFPASLANIIPSDNSTEVRQISSFASDEEYGDVEVIYARQSFRAYLNPLPCTVQVDQHVYTAQLLVLDKTLPLGCSGSWVVVDRKLVGHVIAVREDFPGAYMIPIQSILRDIRLTLGIRRITLPSDESTDNLDENNAPRTNAGSPGAYKSASAAAVTRQQSPPASTRSEVTVLKSKSRRITAWTEGSRPSLRKSFDEKNDVSEQAVIPRDASSVINLSSSQGLLDSHGSDRTRNVIGGSAEEKHLQERLKDRNSRRWWIWRSYEKLLLSLEYRWRRTGKRVFNWSDRYDGLYWVPRGVPGVPHLVVFLGAKVVFTTKMILFMVGICIWNIAYYLTWLLHGPCRLWVIQRHREVLMDEETLELGRRETYHMLGLMPAKPPRQDLERGMSQYG